MAVEEPMPSGEQIAFQPALALVLAEHGIEHTAGEREEFVVGDGARLPLPVGHLEDRAQSVGDGFIGAKEAEDPRCLIELDPVPQELTQDARILGLDGAEGEHLQRMLAKIR